MRLVFVHGTPVWNGKARIFATVAGALGERGYDTWLAAPAGSEAAMQAVQRGVRVLALPADRALWGASRRLRAVFPTDFVDGVFVHSNEDHLDAAEAIRAAGRGMVIRRISAGEELTLDRRGRRAAELAPTRYLFTSDTPPSGHATPSGTLTSLRSEVGVAGDAHAGNGAAIGEGAVLVCVATRESLRRATNVVRAVALLAQRHTTLQLRVLGSAAYEEDLHLLASALGMRRGVEWIGHTADIDGALHGVAAGWVIADGDDAALGALDLMTHGVPVLAERTTVAARYVSNGIHGVLMANLDPPIMAAETAVLLADAERRGAMGGAGRLRAEREFSLREMLAGFEHAARSTRERPVART